MVSDILYYAKDRVPSWERLSALEVAEDVCGLARTRADEMGVALHCELDDDAGDFDGDPQAVRSMLTNLVENSLDACRLDEASTDRQVVVRVRGTPDHVEFEFEDNGIGMDQETREKAFTLFFSSKGMEGTGLGLFIADRIARAHHGSIDLESELGVGTRFVVRLPRVHPDPQESEEPQQSKKDALHV